MNSKEGHIQLRNGYRVWYRQVGDDNRIPLLILHGGPGSGHDYLEPLEKLATGRSVVFYDQLGCGKSDQPDDRSLWHMEYFLEELGEVREALQLTKVHLLGQSWGGILAIEYMLTQPDGVASLVLADSCASMPQLEQEINRLRSQLPAETIATLDRFEATGDFHHSDYRAAVETFYKLHVCGLATMPDCLLRTTANLKNNAVYETMNGPNELVITGNLKDWDRTDQLSQIPVPTLILVGRHDEVTPTCSLTIHQGIAASEFVVFENSTHLPHFEEQEKYLATISRFLFQADASVEL